MKRSFVESSLFARRVNQEGTETLKEIQTEVLKNPEGGRIIQGTGGLRKLRVGDTGRGKGKRGGFRIIYLDLPHVERTHLVALYDKDEKEDISKDEKKALKALVEQIKREAR